MKTSIVLSLFVAIASAAILPTEEQHVPLKEMEGRITNGEIATRGQFPYQVGLSINIEGKRSFCGATLISKNAVLTAAHCLSGAQSAIAIFGASDIGNNNEKGQQRFYCSKSNMIIHENYNATTISNDIAVINLPVTIEFNDYIQPAALPKNGTTYSTYEGKLVWASGWGRYSDSVNTISQNLRYIEVPVMKRPTCNLMYAGMVTENNICTATTGHKSTCNGDSGGPLVYKHDDVNTVIGATSFGIQLGCEKGWPAVYTFVARYLHWIEINTGISNE